MTILKNLGVLALALGGVLVALWRRRRAPAAGKQAHMLVSRRIVDRDERDAQASVRWDDDGGANEGGSDAAIR